MQDAAITYVGRLADAGSEISGTRASGVLDGRRRGYQLFRIASKGAAPITVLLR